MTDSEAATPEASGTPMDLVGKTVRWEHDGVWFTANVKEWLPATRTWRGEVVDPGTFRSYEPGYTSYFSVEQFITVIDPEPDDTDPECE